jgi:ubiquinol-cytochrome c reductase cytochrome c1 subunit
MSDATAWAMHMVTRMNRFLLAFLLLPWSVLAVEEHVVLDRAPIDTTDAASIQRGAKVFVNYCLNCHGAQYMRYNRLTDVGLSEDQIRNNLMFAAEKVGETMTVPVRKADAAAWFGVPPPDLSVIARSRSADWLYSYLRSYYRDSNTATGWNNLVFPNVAMPHVLWELQGQQALKVEEREGPHGKEPHRSLVAASPGTMSPTEYDRLVLDLVNYLVFMGEPNQVSRTRTGYLVLIALAGLFVLAYLLKKEFWKDVH